MALQQETLDLDWFEFPSALLLILLMWYRPQVGLGLPLVLLSSWTVSHSEPLCVTAIVLTPLTPVQKSVLRLSS